MDFYFSWVANRIRPILLALRRAIPATQDVFIPLGPPADLPPELAALRGELAALLLTGDPPAAIDSEIEGLFTEARAGLREIDEVAEGLLTLASLLPHTMSPADLPPEWDRTLRVLSYPAAAAATFYGLPRSSELPLAALARWHQAFHRATEEAYAALSWLPDKAERTRRIAFAILDEIAPTKAALKEAVYHLANHPVGLKVAEQYVRAARTKLAAQPGIDLATLLDRLVEAVEFDGGRDNEPKNATLGASADAMARATGTRASHPDPMPLAARTGTLPATAPPNSDVTAGSIRKHGASWDIKFGREHGSFPVKDYGAIATLAKLLARPRYAYCVDKLINSAAPELLNTPDTRDEVMDRQAVAALQQKLRQLQQMRLPEDPIAERKRSEEMAHILRALKNAKAPGGQIKKLGPSGRDRAWDALQRKLRRLWPRLKEGGMPQLAEHLENTIHFDRPNITYLPPTDTGTWTVPE
jgi:hypothetical protein